MRAFNLTEYCLRIAVSTAIPIYLRVYKRLNSLTSAILAIVALSILFTDEASSKCFTLISFADMLGKLVGRCSE